MYRNEISSFSSAALNWGRSSTSVLMWASMAGAWFQRIEKMSRKLP
jgi:hypothetical protein